MAIETYGRPHSRPHSLVFFLITHRDDIIYARSDPAGVVEVALGVR